MSIRSKSFVTATDNFISLTVWFDEPTKKHICEEVEDDVVLMKDRCGRVIGFERLNHASGNRRR